MWLDDHNETSRAREACDQFLAMGSRRSLPKLAEASLATSDPYPLDTLKKWSQWFHWRARAAQFDHEQSVMRRAELRTFIADQQDAGLRNRVKIARDLQARGVSFINKKSVDDLMSDPEATKLALHLIKEGLNQERADLPTPLKGGDVASDIALPPERRYDAHEIEVFEATVLDVIAQEAPHVRDAIEDSLRSAFAGDAPRLVDGSGTIEGA